MTARANMAAGEGRLPGASSPPLGGNGNLDGRGEATLRRTLGVGSLSMIGVGNAIGTGIFVLTGVAAANYAGPAIAISYLLAGLVCLFAALCYAELGAMLPEAGGSYVYALRAMGRAPAWLVAWAMILEYLIAGSTVAVGWSGYFGDLLRQFGVSIPDALSQSPYQLGVDGGRWQVSVNLPAMLVVLLCTALLTFDVRRSAVTNTVMVLVKLVVILLVIGFGAAYVDPDNWRPFVPANEGDFQRFGWSGVATAAAIAFFSYTGFEAVSMAARETRNPGRDLPLALVISLAACALLYVAMSLVMTGLADFRLLDTASPISTAIRIAAPEQLAWLLFAVNIGVVICLVSAILISLFGQSRVFYAMAREGQMPSVFARINARGVPSRGVLLVGGAASLIAGIFPLTLLGELVAIGCLLAFASVCASTLILRRTMPETARPFRVPMGLVIPAMGLILCLALMLTLPSITLVYFAAWLLSGCTIYSIAFARPVGRISRNLTWGDRKDAPTGDPARCA